MVRRFAWLLLTIGLVALCVGDAALALEQTVMTPGRVRSAAGTILASGPVHRAMARRVVTEVGRQVPGANFLDPTRLNALASATLRDPRFVGAFGDALVQLDDHVFRTRRGDVVLDAAAVTAAVRDAAAETAPQLSATLPPSVTMTVGVDTTGTPDLHVLAAVVRATTRLAIPVGLVLVVVGVEFAPRRRRAVARAGRWAIVVGSLHLLILGLVARFVLSAFGPWAAVAAAVIRGTAAPGLVAGALLVTAGAVAVGAVHRIDTASRRRARAAALDELSRRTSWRPPPRERSHGGPDLPRPIGRR